jgi:hypothetical protein
VGIPDSQVGEVFVSSIQEHLRPALNLCLDFPVHTTGSYTALTVKYDFDGHLDDKLACMADIGWTTGHKDLHCLLTTRKWSQHHSLSINSSLLHYIPSLADRPEAPASTSCYSPPLQTRRSTCGKPQSQEFTCP